MEQSAYEAVTIAVGVFVFIIALTAGILLMSNIISMVNYANENAIIGMGGSIAESIGKVEERIYTGEQLLVHYRKSMEGKEKNSVYKVQLSTGGQVVALNEFIESKDLSNYLYSNFTLQYNGKENEKDSYIFRQIVEDT